MLREHLKNQFEIDLFKGCLENIVDKANRLRLNNYACSIRELIRNMLARLSPDSEIENSEWFNKEDYGDEKGRPTRRARLQFALIGGLLPDFVSKELIKDYRTKIDDMVKLISELSKYIHIGLETFPLPDDLIESNALEINRIVDVFFQQITSIREVLISKYEELIFSKVDDALTSDVIDEIDLTSTHYYIEEINLESIKVTEILSENIRLFGEGKIHTILQYGSDSDQKNGLGGVSPFDFSFSFEILIPCSDPEEITIKKRDISVDDRQFYGMEE